MDKKWWTLLAVCAGTFMLLLDVTIVIVAQPAIQGGLHASFSDVQWTLDAYALTLASLLLTSGVLADRYGRKRLFAIGLAIFTVGSLLCALAWNEVSIIVFRIVQGVGGALIMANSGAVIADLYPREQRGRAYGFTSLGWTVGGRWLATSGSTQIILWPFQTKDGPMGKQPRLLAPSEHRIGVVACHPKQDIVAVGYGDGLVLLVRIEDGAEILAKKPGDSPVTALAWSADGMLLAWGTESGQAGIVDLA